jgi:hypothetical protein
LSMKACVCLAACGGCCVVGLALLPTPCGTAATVSGALAAIDPLLGTSTGRLGGRAIPIARRLLHPAPAGLGEAHRLQAAGNQQPTPLNRVGNPGGIGLDRAQVTQGLPSLRLAAGRLIEFAHDANRRFLARANFWRASSACSALRCCALWQVLCSFA